MFYNVIIRIAYVLCLLLFNIKFEGLENIPEDEGYILCSNHRTYFDPIFVAVKIPRSQQLNFMAKEELFKNKFFGWFISKLNAFPISRGKGDSKTLDKSVEILKSGQPLLIFIEGTRSKNGVPGRPRSGASLIAGRAGAGILPCSVDYGERLGFRKKVVVKYHPLLTTEDLNIDLESAASLRASSKMVMDSIISGLTHLPEKEQKQK